MIVTMFLIFVDVVEHGGGVKDGLLYEPHIVLQPPYHMLQGFIRSQQTVGHRDEKLDEGEGEVVVFVVVVIMIGHGGGVKAGTVFPGQIGKQPPYGIPQSLVYVAQAC